MFFDDKCFKKLWIQLFKKIDEFNNVKLMEILDIFHRREDE